MRIISIIKRIWTTFFITRVHLASYFLPNRKAHFILAEKYFTKNIFLYGCKYLEDCLRSYYDTLQQQMTPSFDIAVQNRKHSDLEQTKIVKKACISTQIFSAINRNEQLLTLT